MSVLEIGFWWWVVLSVLGLAAAVVGLVFGLIAQRSKVQKPVRSYELDEEHGLGEWKEGQQ